MDETNPQDTDAQAVPSGRAFLSDGVGLTPLEGVPWGSRQLRAVLSVALADARLTAEGAFAVVPGRHAGAYTARRLVTLPPHAPVVLRVVRWEERWIAVGPEGTEPREVFGDGHSRPWDGPVPVEVLA